jgi:N4-gp56 family major capsid protein
MKKNKYNLQLFAGELNVNATTSSGLTDEMKKYYSDYLIDNAVPKLVHDQFGQKHPIPKNGGKTIEFRKYSPLPKLTTPITEGVTPDGQSLNMSTVEATVAQYGGYITLSDMLLLSAIDNNLVQATKLLGAQAGATLDTITREVLNGGTNVIFADGGIDRASLGALGENGPANLLTVADIKNAVRLLKTQNAEQIDGSWIGIIHPDVAYDLTNDPAWKDVKTYSDPDDMYEGEIGKIFGVRFVETTEAKIWAGAGDHDRAVYSTLILGANAYGTTEITGGGLEHIVKQLGSAGTADPINQRATVGWKATKVAERLVENYMVRIESASTFDPTTNN